MISDIMVAERWYWLESNYSAYERKNMTRLLGKTTVAQPAYYSREVWSLTKGGWYVLGVAKIRKSCKRDPDLWIASWLHHYKTIISGVGRCNHEGTCTTTFMPKFIFVWPKNASSFQLEIDKSILENGFSITINIKKYTQFGPSVPFYLISILISELFC